MLLPDNLMNLVILIIAVVVGAEWVKNHHTQVPANWSFLGRPVPKVAPTNAPVATNIPITEAAYNQDAGVRYTPAFGTCTIEMDGQEYIL